MNEYLKWALIAVAVYAVYRVFFGGTQMKNAASSATKTAIANQEIAGSWEL